MAAPLGWSVETIINQAYIASKMPGSGDYLSLDTSEEGNMAGVDVSGIETLPPFPEGIVMVYIKNFPNLKSIPPIPDSVNDVTLQDLPSLTEMPVLPPSIDSIYLSNLPLINALPPLSALLHAQFINVGLTSFDPPATLISMQLTALEKLTRIGPISYTERIVIYECPELIELPDIMPGASSFQLGICMKITTLPRLPRASYLEVRASGITSIPSFPSAMRSVSLHYLPNITEIPPFPETVETISLGELKVESLPDFPQYVEEITIAYLGKLRILPRIPDECTSLLVTNVPSLTTLTGPVGKKIANTPLETIFPGEEDGAFLEPSLELPETMGAYFARKSSHRGPRQMWQGYSKEDEELFESMFRAADFVVKKPTTNWDGVVGEKDHTYSPSADFSLCPFCLGYASRSDSVNECMYMHHKCPEQHRHEKLFQAYKGEGDEVSWCTVCGRPCKGHGHVVLGAPEDMIQDLVPYPPGVEVDFFGNDCKPYGGGGKVEKFMRMDTLLQVACDTQQFVGVKDAQEVRSMIVERIWKSIYEQSTGPLPSLEAAAEKAKRPIKARCDLPAKLPEAVLNYPDIVRPADEAELTPIKHEAPDNECTAELGPHEDNRPVYQFRHKQSNGTVWDHKNQYFCGEDLMALIDSQPFTGLCPIDPEHCKSRLYPEELVGIVPETYHARYKRLFNEAQAVRAGGAGSGIMYSIAPEDLQCLLPPKKSGKRRVTYRIPMSKGSKRRKTPHK